jgi:hypothetical protein
MLLSYRQRWPRHERPSPLQRPLVLQPCLPPRLLLGKPLWRGIAQTYVSRVLRIGLVWRSWCPEQRWRIAQRSPLLLPTPRILHGKSSSLRTSMRRSVGRGRRLRGRTESISRSSPFCRLRTLSNAMPSSTLLREDTYPRGCGLQPSAILN